MTTKVCPYCSSDKLALMATLQKKFCADCSKIIPWNLDKGQKGLIHNGEGK